jgi:hypothetical protein
VVNPRIPASHMRMRATPVVICEPELQRAFAGALRNKLRCPIYRQSSFRPKRLGHAAYSAPD